MRDLPIDERGFPVPWFVWIDEAGKPDFRVVKPGAIERAVRRASCWLCGEGLGQMRTFVIGPMCGVNRVTSEPPCHYDCAVYAVKACPFLTRPGAVRRERDMPEHRDAAGIMLTRNPGVTLLWTIKGPVRFFRVGGDERGNPGILFRLPDPLALEAWAHGRIAQDRELAYAINSGLPLLAKEAAKDGKEGMLELAKQCDHFAAVLERRGVKITLDKPELRA